MDSKRPKSPAENIEFSPEFNKIAESIEKELSDVDPAFTLKEYMKSIDNQAENNDGEENESTCEFFFRDPVVMRVCEKFVGRSNVGFEKYGRTLHAERTEKLKDLSGYLNDVQEELMDAILYIQAAREEYIDIQNGLKNLLG